MLAIFVPVMTLSDRTNALSYNYNGELWVGLDLATVPNRTLLAGFPEHEL